MTQFRSVAEDIEWLRDEWWLGPADSLSDGHLRRGSAALGLLLVDGFLQKAWHHYGFEDEPAIQGPDASALALRKGLRLEHASAVITGGGREADQDIAFLGLFRVDHPETGVPADADSGFAVVQTGILLDAFATPTPGGDLNPLVNRVWSLSAYLEAPGAVRRGILISRRDIIQYFRTYAGGVGHYEAQRYGDSGSEEDKRNQVISELVGLVHANLRDGLSFELLSIGQAVGRSADFWQLAAKIRAAEDEERRTIPPVSRYEKPMGKGSVMVMNSPGPAGLVDPEAQLLGNLLGIRSPDVPIYRTFRLKHLRTMLATQALALIAPRRWDDPFETLLSHAVLIDTNRGGLSRQIKLRKPLYGLCWSFNTESDALWRIYSTVIKDLNTERNASVDEEGVRVRTTARRLLNALWRASPVDPTESCFLGSVRYMPQREALQHISGIVHSAAGTSLGGRTQAESLLIKREPFAHEREARLIFVEPRSGFGGEDLFQIHIDPNELFRHVTLDPRLSAEDAQERKAQLRDLGFAGEIVQSRLYQDVQLEVRI